MKRLVEFPIGQQDSVIVEVDETGLPGGSERIALRPGEVAEKAKQAFDVALDRIKPSASAIITALRGISDPADEISVEFGLKMSAEAGAVIAAAGIEANYKITLKWKRAQAQNGDAA